MSEEILPKPQTDLPKPDKDLPLPEKDLPTGKQKLPAQTSQPNQKVVKEEHKGLFIFKSFLLGIFFVIIMVAIGGGSFLLGRNTKSENNQVAETKISSPTPTPEWNIYTSSEGYEFKYPNNLTEFDPPTRAGVSRLDAVFIGVPDSDQSILFESYPNNEKLTIREWWNKNGSALLLSQALDYSTIPIKTSEIKISEKKIGNNSFLMVDPINGPGAQYFISNGEIIVNIRPGLINDVDQILSTFKFTDSTSQFISPNPTKPTTANRANLENIKYTLPSGWTPKLQSDSLTLSPSNGGFISIEVYNYDGETGRRDFYCRTTNICLESSSFTQTKIGNISGYKATGLDNSGGGSEYFGEKGNKFYIISTYNPPSPNDFEKNYQSVLDSLQF